MAIRKDGKRRATVAPDGGCGNSGDGRSRGGDRRGGFENLPYNTDGSLVRETVQCGRTLSPNKRTLYEHIADGPGPLFSPPGPAFTTNHDIS